MPMTQMAFVSGGQLKITLPKATSGYDVTAQIAARPTANAILTLNSDGTWTASGTSGGTWLTGGVSSDVKVYLSGSPPSPSGAGFNTSLNLGTSRTWFVYENVDDNGKTASATFDFSLDAGGVIATRTIFFYADTSSG